MHLNVADVIWKRRNEEMNGSHFFKSDYLFPGFCLSSLFEGKRQNVTIIIHDMLLGQFPQRYIVPDDEQTSRGHPANWSHSKHPSVLRGSDPIAAVRFPSPATDHTRTHQGQQELPPLSERTSHNWSTVWVHAFFSCFCSQGRFGTRLISIGCPQRKPPSV